MNGNLTVKFPVKLAWINLTNFLPGCYLPLMLLIYDLCMKIAYKTNIAEGAASGIITGGVLGGLAGLLVGVGVLALPGIGALFVAGPLAAVLGLAGTAATTVSGALIGSLVGGIVGALVGLGLAEEEVDLDQFPDLVYYSDVRPKHKEAEHSHEKHRKMALSLEEKIRQLFS